VAEFSANQNPLVIATEVLVSPIFARFVKVVLQGVAGDGALRAEFYTPHEFRMADSDLLQLGSPLGMENGLIRAEQIRASSVYANSTECAPANARLHRSLGVGGWCSQVSDGNQWIEVDLLKPTAVGGVAIQGRGGDVTVKPNWVTSYRMQSSPDGVNWAAIPAPGGVPEFRGSHSSVLAVAQAFDQPVTARYFRLLPTGWFAHISLRMELYTPAATAIARDAETLAARRQAVQGARNDDANRAAAFAALVSKGAAERRARNETRNALEFELGSLKQDMAISKSAQMRASIQERMDTATGKVAKLNAEDKAAAEALAKAAEADRLAAKQLRERIEAAEASLNLAVFQHERLRIARRRLAAAQTDLANLQILGAAQALERTTEREQNLNLDLATEALLNFLVLRGDTAADSSDALRLELGKAGKAAEDAAARAALEAQAKSAAENQEKVAALLKAGGGIEPVTTSRAAAPASVDVFKLGPGSGNGTRPLNGTLAGNGTLPSNGTSSLSAAKPNPAAGGGSLDPKNPDAWPATPLDPGMEDKFHLVPFSLRPDDKPKLSGVDRTADVSLDRTNPDAWPMPSVGPGKEDPAHEIAAWAPPPVPSSAPQGPPVKK
jgi:hypothetical protein